MIAFRAALVSLAIMTHLLASPPQGAPEPVPTVAILSPADGAQLAAPIVGVSVAYAAGEARGNPRVGLLELRGNDILLASAALHGKDGRAGTHDFVGVDLTRFLGTGEPVVLRARARQGNERNGSSADSVPVSVRLPEPPADTIPPVVTTLLPAPGSFVGTASPTLRSIVTDAGGSGLDPQDLVLALNGISVPFTTSILGPDAIEIRFTPGSLLEGGHLFSVDARDRAGNAAPRAVSTFVVDLTTPVIAVLSPVSGPVTAGALPLQATVSDALSGLDVSGLVVELDGTPVAVTVTPGPSGAYGSPASAELTGTIVTDEGQHVLRVAIRDLAGLTASVTILLDAGSPPPPAGPAFLLTKVSGDGQSGLAGRPATSELAVQVTNANTGVPVRGLTPIFGAGLNGGTFVLPAGRDSVTDSNGTVRLRYIFGERPGTQTVRVSLPDAPGVEPVQFTLTAELPSIADESVQGPFNCHYGTSEYPGSALGRIFTVRARDHEGAPLRREVVRPRVVGPDGLPPATPTGTFLPSRAWTDDAGNAKFVFVIAPDAPTGAFTLRFGLPAFRETDGEEVKLDVGGAVLDPAFKPTNAGISYDDPAASGQGQRGIPGRQLAIPLRAKGVRSIYYTLLEGAGAMTPGTEGVLNEAGVDAFCGGAPYVGVRTPMGSGVIEENVNIHFTPETDFVLISIEGATDIFAVAPSEVLLVAEAAGPRPVVPNVVSWDPAQPDPTQMFRVLARVPKGTPAPTGTIAALDGLGEPYAGEPGLMGALSASLTMTLSPADSKPEYDAFVSGPLLATTALLAPGDTPTGGGLAQILSTSVAGGLEAQVQVGPRRVEVRARNMAVLKRGDNLRGLIFNKTQIPGGANRTPNLLKLYFNFDDPKLIRDVLWDLDGDGETDKIVKTPEIYVNYEDVGGGGAGTEGDAASVGVPENQDNHRKIVRPAARVLLEDGGQLTLPAGILRLALHERQPVGSTPPPGATQAGLASVANWNVTPPTYGDPEVAVVFTPVVPPAGAPPTPDYVLKQIPAGINLDARRLSYFGALEGGRAATIRDPRTFGVYGSLIGGSAFSADLGALQATIDHEASHVKATHAAQGGATLFQRLTLALRPLYVATGDLDAHLTEFEHAQILLEDLADPRYSYRTLNDFNSATRAGEAGREADFIRSFNMTLLTLVKNSANCQIMTNAGAIKLKPLNDAVLATDVLDYLKEVYDEGVRQRFPELLQRSEFADTVRLLEPKP